VIVSDFIGVRSRGFRTVTRTDANKVHQQIRGELDWIVFKALEKDRARRYESAASFRPMSAGTWEMKR
jgi:hypothetical protein